MIQNINLKDFPHSSGVYWIKDVDGVVIYVGSSCNLYNRMKEHRSFIKKGVNSNRNKDLYQFLQNNQFTVEFTLEENYLQLEEQLIEKYNPKFNCRKAYTGCGSFKEYSKQYYEFHKEEKKQHSKEYYKSHKEEMKQYYNQCNNRLCNFNGETLTLNALSKRFKRLGISHPKLEAKKYLIG